MAASRPRLERIGATLLLALLVTALVAGCGAGGYGVEVFPKGQQPPPPSPQGVNVQCDPTSSVALDSVKIRRAGTTIPYPAHLAPGQQMFLELPEGSYGLYGLWWSTGFLMEDSVPINFTVQRNQVTYVSWK